jgi:hypothetical protein
MTSRTTATPGRASAGSGRTIASKTDRATPGTRVEHRASLKSTQVEHKAAPTHVAHGAAPERATHVVHKKAAPAKSAKSTAHHEESSMARTASKTTTDHDAIRKWAEKRGGHPTSVTGTEHGKEGAGILRLDFGVKDEKLQPVDWDAFFDKFEESKLAFLYQDKTASGKMSRFHKFIHRH